MFMEATANLYSGEQGYVIHDPNDYTDGSTEAEA